MKKINILLLIINNNIYLYKRKIMIRNKTKIEIKLNKKIHVRTHGR